MDFEKMRDKCANTLAKGIAACATPFYNGVKKIKNMELPSKGSLNSKLDINKITNAPKKYYYDNKHKLDKPLTFVKANKVYVLGGSAGITLALIGVITFGSASTDVTSTLALEKISDPTQLAAVTKESGEEKFSSEQINYTKDVDAIMDMSIMGYELRAYNKSAGFFTSKIEALDTLDDLRGMYVGKLEDSSLIDSYFKELTSIEPAYMSIVEWDGLKTKEEALNYIVKGTKEETFHQVAKGENFWTIASLYNVTVNSLVSANPDIKPERIQIGQKISLTVPRPLITVVTVEEAQYVENIQYAIEYKDDSSIYKGESRTTKSGKSGEREVVAKIIKSNGIEKNRVVISENITKEPVTKIVAKGTKNPPPKIGTGTFARPTSRGVVTSGFGYRWGRRHNGLDIGMPIGTTVKAADGGVVIFAGTKSGYGKVVYIDHGANKVSIYAHNSALTVKKGDKVFKGQQIARSGNTGISTGPHLHFEIRVNGTPVNPTKYVNY